MRKKIFALILALGAAGSIMAASAAPAVAVQAAPSIHAVSNGTWHFE